MFFYDFECVLLFCVGDGGGGATIVHHGTDLRFQTHFPFSGFLIIMFFEVLISSFLFHLCCRHSFHTYLD